MERSAKKQRSGDYYGTTTGPSCSHGMAISSGYDYEVFLSFRGPDTREGFTDFLYTSLDGAGIRTFKDDEELRIGEEFAPKLLQAIKQSKISIPIFSKDYASSGWCLKELAQMVECKKSGEQKIMPIFYDVAPSEVRYQTGGYGRAFRSHEKEKRYDEKTMREWKAALEEVSSLDGWDLQSMPNRQEGELAKTVTQEVFNNLKKAYLAVSDYLVSVDDHVDEIKKMIGGQTGETRIIGIHGIGGVGKSTIAKIIYNQFSNNFEDRCFLSNIREMSERKGIEWLQHQLISSILKSKWIDIKNIDEGTQTIKDRLSTKKVLLLLDDVDHKKHMDALLGERNWFGTGSKIIITTRNKEVLNVPEVDDSYEVDGMDTNQSLQLFSKHAFRRDSPLDDYIKQSKRAIDIAGGLPLALEVIGSLLSHTKKEKWDITLGKLANVPHADVQSKLKISYDALDDEEKYIFLDIACLFIGYDKDIVIHFWDESKLFPKVAMEDLQNMSLIKIGKNNEVWMHDQLKNLGREIVRKKSDMKIEKQSRVWDPKEGLNLLRRHKGSKEVEAPHLKLDHQQQYRFTYEGFESLSNLRFLEVDGSMEKFCAETRLLWHESPSNALPTDDNSYLLPQLRWLSWHDIPLTFNITNFSMEDVVILDLSESEITHTWKGWSHMTMMKNLKVLNLTGCQLLKRTPNFSAHVNLEHLILRDCGELVKIDGSICQLIRLVSLDVRGCQSLRGLPKELGRLEALKELRIDGTRIKKIPNCQGMRNLRIFTASSCQIIELPPTIEYLESLEYLSLEYCVQLASLPDSIGKLESLIELDLRETSIRELPDSIGNLKNLKVVKMPCDPTSKIPNSFWTIEKLEEIEVTETRKMRFAIAMGLVQRRGFHVEIGNCIYRNQSLRILRLCGSKIHAVPRLPESLVNLEFERLDMNTFPDLSNLTNLKKLVLAFGSCDSDGESDGPIEEDPMPQWIGNLSKLETLELDCDYVTALHPDVIHLHRLQVLRLECSNLHCLPSLPSSLLSVSLNSCQSFCSVDVSNLKKLSTLHIFDCAISEIRGLDLLENVKVLGLRDLQEMEILPDLSNLNKLELLEVAGCNKLVEIQGKLPQSLESLTVSSCGSLQQLPDLSSLRGPQRISVRECVNMFEIPGELPQSLEELYISRCELLQNLPDLSSLKGLRKVAINGCGKLDVKAISLHCSEKSIQFESEGTSPI